VVVQVEEPVVLHDEAQEPAVVEVVEEVEELGQDDDEPGHEE